MLALGAIAAVTVHGVYALLNGQGENRGSSIATGTLTLGNTNTIGSASTTLAANVGMTTLATNVNASGTTITVASSSSFQSTPFVAIVDHEQMNVTNVSGVTWTVTRGYNGTQAAPHSSSANVSQTTVTVTSATGFPASGGYTVIVGSEKMFIYSGGSSTTTWLARRAADGTTVAAHSSGATIATQACRSIDGTGNVNSSCDAVLAFSAGAELNPGSTTTTNVRIDDTGSIGAKDLEMYMSSCLRGVTPDFYLSLPVMAAPTFTNASTTGGALLGGTTYYYEITAVNANGESIAGNEASYSVPAGTNTNTIQVNWPAFAGATTYNVYRGTSPGSETWTQSDLTTTSYVSTQTTTLAAAITTTGQTAITVTSAAGFPTTSNFVVTIGSEQMLVTAVNGTSWTVTRGYHGTTTSTYANGTSLSAGFTSATTPPTGSPIPAAPTFSSPSTTGGALAGGTSYYYEVTAVGQSGESIAGSEAVYTPPLGTSTNSIQLNWSAVPGATSYNIYRATTEGGETEVQSGLTVTAWVDTQTTTLSAAITTTGQTTIHVNSSSGYPASGPFVVTIGSEEMNVTNVTGTTWTVTRGYNGTTASTYSIGTTITAGFTSATSPPSAPGAGDPCSPGNAEFYVQETNSSGTATKCWYPSTVTTCAYDNTLDLGLFATIYNTLGTALDVGAGPAATATRYFSLGFRLSSTAGNTLQGTEAIMTLNWYAFAG
ncbi:MAG TPA: hypothetical protein VKR79_06140 [Gaiellaceae bacterium]|nr:hypothetical protein [Gaiellaceae bacterium]